VAEEWWKNDPLAKTAEGQNWWESDPLTNPPPPGVIIHDVNRSYVAGRPDLSVDTTGMAPGIGTGAVPAPGTNPNLPNRADAAAALALRRDNSQALPTGVTAPTLQGMTLGYGDEALSAGAGLGSMARGGSFGDAYNLAQEAQRQERAQYGTEHPVLSPVLQAGGALANIPALMAAGVPGMAAGAGGASLGGRVLATAAGGGLLGGAEGFGSGSGFLDRLKQAGYGGLTGAAVGGAVPLAATGLSNVFTDILDRINVNPYLRQLGIDRPAANITNRVLAADDAFGGGVGSQNITAAGPQGMIADAGPATQGLLDVAIQRGGGGSKVARDAVDARGVEANRTLTDALDTTLGQPRGIQTMINDIRQTGQPARSSAYDTAYNTPIDYSHPDAAKLEELLGRLRGKASGAVDEANLMMQLDGEPLSRQIKATIAADGSIVFDRVPDVRQIDYITRGLRKTAGNPENTGALGGQTDTSRRFNSLAGQIRQVTRDLVPEYGVALDTAADDIGRVQATELGNKLLSPSVTRDEAVQMLKGHNSSAAEMDAVRLGVRQHIDDQMANVRKIATDPNLDARQAAAALKDLSSDAANAKLDMILDPAQRQHLTAQIEEATRAIQLRANMSANSKTFARGAVDDATKQLLEYGPFGAAARGQPVNMLQRATQAFTGYTPAYDISRLDLTNRQIAELLTNARGPAAQQQIGLLGQVAQTGAQNAAGAQTGGGLLGLAGAVPGYATTRDTLRNWWER